MKKILSYTSLIIAFSAMSSCNHLLDLEPITEQTEALFYRTEKDANLALVAVYDLLQWETFEMYSEVLSENCYGGGGSSSDIPQFVRMSQGNMDPLDGNIANIWSKFYQGIYRANILLEKIDDIKFEQQVTKDRMVAECKFLRAYYYWGLVRSFGNVPLILKTLVPSEYYTQHQATPAEVFAQIKKDLTEAISGGLPSRASITSSEKGRVSIEAARSLLVRIWLFYTGAYNQSDLAGMNQTEATTMIESVIATSGAELYENFGDNFNPSLKNGKESIFEIQYANQSRWGDWNYLQGGDGNFAIIRWGMRTPAGDKCPFTSGWSFAPVSPTLFNAYDANDKRFIATIINMTDSVSRYGWSYEEGYQNTGYFNRKFTCLAEYDPAVTGAGGSRELNFPNNIPVIRYSDVLLMASELQLNSNPQRAQECYAQVVRRAMGSSYAVPTVNLDLLRRERMLEFALEGIRYWDLLRYGQDYAKTVIEGSNASAANATMNKTYNLARKGLMPIPQEQVILCRGALVQNPGY